MILSVASLKEKHTFAGQIAYMNSLFGRALGDAEAGTQNAIDQHSYTESEWDEVILALNHGYVSDELRDGLSDCLTTSIGSIWRAGVDTQYYFTQSINEIRGGFAQVVSTERNLLTVEFEGYRDEIDTLVKDIATSLKTKNYTNEQFCQDLDKLINALIHISVFIGVDPVDDLYAVTVSNVSKLCYGQTSLENTYEKYDSIGVKLFHTEVERDVFAVYSLGDQVDHNGKKYEANKFLKSVEFMDPVFAPMVKHSPIEAAHAAAAVDIVQNTPKIELVGENGQPI